MYGVEATGEDDSARLVLLRETEHGRTAATEEMMKRFLKSSKIETSNEITHRQVRNRVDDGEER